MIIIFNKVLKSDIKHEKVIRNERKETCNYEPVWRRINNIVWGDESCFVKKNKIIMLQIC